MKWIKFKVSEEEKKKLDIAKAKSDYDEWKSFFLSSVESDDSD